MAVIPWVHSSLAFWSAAALAALHNDDQRQTLDAACALCHSDFVIPSSLHIRASSLLTGTER
jgi:cytochrome c553